MLTHGRDSLCGDVLIERASACGEEHVSVDEAELLAVFGDAGGAPAQRHLPALPVLHVARVGAGDGDHRLDAVRAAPACGPAWAGPLGAARSAFRAGLRAARRPGRGGCARAPWPGPR